MNRISATGGDDRAEANLVGLYKVAKNSGIGWREDSRKVLVYFGDEPGHEPTCNSGISRLTRTNVIEELKFQNITVVAMSVGANNLNGPTDAFGCGESGAGAGQAN